MKSIKVETEEVRRVLGKGEKATEQILFLTDNTALLQFIKCQSAGEPGFFLAVNLAT